METEFSGQTLLRVADDIKKFGVADDAIAELKAKYAPLVIDGVDDLKGFETVKKARLEVRKYRTRVEDVRKALKSDSLEYGRRVDSEAKRITGLILEVETDLQQKEMAIEQERQRIAMEAQRKLEERIAHRIEQARKAGVEFDGVAYRSGYCDLRLTVHEIDSLDDNNFAALLLNAAAIKAEVDEAARQVEAQRIAEEQAELERMQLERDRLAAEQAALEVARKQMDAERSELEALRAEKAQNAAIAAQPLPSFEQPKEEPQVMTFLTEPTSEVRSAFPWEKTHAEIIAETLPCAKGWLELWAACPICGSIQRHENHGIESKCDACGAKFLVLVEGA